MVNEIAFFICTSVFPNKSNQERACCTFCLMRSQIKSNCPAVTLCFLQGKLCFNFKFSWTYSLSLRQRCRVSGFVTEEGSWVGRRQPYCACQSERRGGEKAQLSNHLSAFDVRKDGRAQLKGHYCVSKSTPISHVTSNKQSYPAAAAILVYFLLDFWLQKSAQRTQFMLSCKLEEDEELFHSKVVFLSSCCAW